MADRIDDPVRASPVPIIQEKMTDGERKALLARIAVPMRRSSIVVERYVETPRAWILTRGPVDNGGSVGLTVQGRQIICGADGYSLGDEEPINVLTIDPVWEAQGDQSDTGVVAVIIPGELYAFIEEMDAQRKRKKSRKPDESSSDQVEMWAVF